MDFSTIELDAEHQQLQTEVRAFIAEHLTPEVFAHELATGDNFNERVHRAMGERGWIMPHWPKERGGAGLDRLGLRILDVEFGKAKLPSVTLGTTRLISPAIEKYASPAIRDEVLAGIAGGSVRLCLGYTEPHGGSDIAGARTRAVKDGSDWVINGSKMFTTGAHNSQYAFLITRTDPTLPKHKGLSMFLLPLETPGVEIQGIRAFSGERTNMVFFDDVRIDEKYLLGEPNGGWTVLRGPLDEEHSIGDGNPDGLDEVSIGWMFLREVQDAIDGALDWAVTARQDGTRPADDPSVLERLGRIAIEAEAALVTPGPSGRVKGGETTVQIGSELLDLLGYEALVSMGQADALAGGQAEFVHRYAQGTVTYGGTVEVFRTIIAQHELGLPRPNYPGSKVLPTTTSV
ncbi:acyl-CoA dehydrogenase family protein [Microbacterium sp.]|uniref:acyl-CoA dehydrogenase family protein n=1 Tax=Microbacterium sp. TaxID=51671 RepID=UPI002CF931F4|nr:acyl-CoA dehydrogenase family protein [Microbacterium sp.]HWK76299.1 acyl-CoA dehydrogenase family protein [Microbacterium sp.]